MPFSLLQAQVVKDTDGLFRKDGQLFTGQHAELYASGKLHKEIYVLDGLLHGTVKVFTEDGVMIELQSYLNGQMHGTWESFNPDTQTQTALASYHQGKKHGPWSVWNAQGVLLYEMNYLNGERSGIWNKYDAQGRLIESVDYGRPQ